jgi:hypothetical protein
MLKNPFLPVMLRELVLFFWKEYGHHGPPSPKEVEPVIKPSPPPLRKEEGGVGS